MNRKFSNQSLWTLFFVCVFPMHVWAIILISRDVSWAAQRTNFWDAMGLAAYGLLLALLESIVFFLVTILIGWFLPVSWSEERRVALLSVLVFITALWAINGQAYFVWGGRTPAAFLRLAANSAHPLRVLYAGTLALVLPTLLIPAILVLRSERVVNLVKELNDRLSLLSMFYLFLDVVGLIIVLVRNI